MYTYKVIVSDQAKSDVRWFVKHIAIVYGQPATARRYEDGIWNTIWSLSRMAGLRQANPYVQGRYGVNARHIVYKKVSIIYVIEGEYVYVSHVISGALLH
ncbi:MAG: hypothetical protein LBU08_02005 [Tannerellaceae bacterium]|jgi:plasmid stabilization system protein ParE|nr:hypothetical protein [Tannerellaceae bacterium]